MTPQERDLITALLARLQQQTGQAQDPEADALIRQATSRQQDADYLLVQTVLIQDMALHDAQHRIAELERQLGTPTAAPQNAPSFLPQRGGSSQSQNQSSVPAAGPWGAAPAQDPPPRRDSVWSRNIQPPQQPAQAAPQPAANYAPPGYGYGPASGYGPSMLAGGGGGFLRQAAMTAAGVVGGQLLFQGIHSMFSPTYGGGFMSGMPMQPGISETVVNNYYNDPNTAYDPGQNNDQGTTQADYSDNQGTGQDYSDSGQDFGGGNDDGGSFNV